MVNNLEVCKYHLNLFVLEPIPLYKTYINITKLIGIILITQ